MAERGPIIGSTIFKGGGQRCQVVATRDVGGEISVRFESQQGSYGTLTFTIEELEAMIEDIKRSFEV